MFIWSSKIESLLLSNRLSKIFMAVLIILFGWQLGIMVTHSIVPSEQVALPELAQYSQTPSSKTPTEARPSYLLGSQELAAESVNGVVQNSEGVQASKLNLKLIGLMALPKGGIALIEEGSKTHIVGIGESIVTDVTLHEVYFDYVVILHKGVLEKLTMETSDLDLTGDSTSEAVPLTEQQQSVLDTIGEQLRKAPMAITHYIRFQPISENGKVVAIKVWPRKEVAIFKGLGFQSGDELRTVNGVSVENLAQSPTLWQTLLQENQLEMRVDRQGKSEILTVRLN